MNYLEDVGEDLAVTNETKKCPYCGGEIKAVALKCKHCGKFLEEVKSGDIIYQEPLKNNKGRNIGIGCAWFLGIFIILGIIGAIFGSFIAFKFDNKILKKLFGIFLIIIAILESYSFFRQYIIRKKEDNKSK